jgi:hypothetical protein
LSATESGYFDAVVIDHSLVLQNFCKPKCPPENIKAFAYYLNRVTDGTLDLHKLISNRSETRGKGVTAYGGDPTVFAGTNFCSDEGSPFLRCNDPSNAGSYISCGNKFIKYYHEGQTLELYYADTTTTRKYTIVEVLSDTVVRVTPPPTSAGHELYFRVADNGVISNLNCATEGYNEIADTLTNPYFKVKYTTSEQYNTAGNYSTYLSVVVALFNPSKETTRLSVSFAPTKLSRQGDIKIRSQAGIQITKTAQVELNCKEYAFVEIIYYILCGEQGGGLAISVYDITSGTTQIGETYNLPQINGAECPGISAGNVFVLRAIPKNNTVVFIEEGGEVPTTYVGLGQNVSETSMLFGSPPSWLNSSPDYTTGNLILSVTSNSFTPATVSQRYICYFRSYRVTGEGTVSGYNRLCSLTNHHISIR